MPTKGARPTARAVVTAVPIFASLFSQTMYGPSAFVLLPCLVLLVWIAAVHRTRIYFAPWHFALLALWLVFVLSTSVSGIVAVQSDTFSFLADVLFIIFVTAVEHTRGEIRFLWGAYVAAGLMAATSVLYNVSVGHQAVWHRYSTSFFGVDRDPNYVGAFIVAAVPLAAFWMIYKSRGGILSVLVLSVLVAGAVATGSRSSLVWLALLAVLVLALGLSRTNTNRVAFVRRTTALGALAASIVVAIFGYLPDSLVERLTSSDSLFADDSRRSAWSLGLEIFRDSPVIGVGLDGGNVLIVDQVGINSHNVYIDILMGSGVLGAACFLYVLWALVWRRKRDRLALVTLAAGMLGPLAFINGFNTLSFWVPLMMIGVTSTYVGGGRGTLRDVVSLSPEPAQAEGKAGSHTPMVRVTPEGPTSVGKGERP